jgi:hypothetical protein
MQKKKCIIFKTNKFVTRTGVNPLCINGSIDEDDVYYNTDNVCILKPGVKKGVMIKHHYHERDVADVIKNGVKSGSRLQVEGVQFGRNVAHDSIFFRAPYIYTPQVDRSCIENEIIASFGKVENNCVYLRVDPAQTNTFSSEIRVRYRSEFIPNISIETRRATELRKIEQQIQNSKKLMTKYFEIIENNKNLHQPQKDYVERWNLFSSIKSWVPFKSNAKRNNVKRNNVKTLFSYPWDDQRIERNSEVLIGPRKDSMGIGIHIPSECFAHVT